MTTIMNVFLSMFIMFIFFYPAGYLSKYIYGLSHKFLILIIIYIHIISTGGLYFRQEIYSYDGWTAIKDFDFTFLSLIKSYFPLLMFMLIFLFFVMFLNLLIKIFHKKKNLFYKVSISKLFIFFQSKIFLIRKKNKHSSILIFIIGLFQLSASLVMFYSGKGIVGLVPDDNNLPFKIIGISYYVSKMIAPLLIALLFIKYKTSRIIFIYILLISLVSGSAQLSRSTFLISIIIPFVIILIDKKKFFFKAFSCLFILYGLYHIESARILILFHRDPLGMMDISPYIYEWYTLFFKSVLNMTTYHFWEYSLYNIYDIVGRVSSTQDIILGTQFNLELIGGAIEELKGIIFHKFQKIDGEAYHMAWMGVNLPPGYAAGGSVLSSVTAFWFYEKIVFLMSALYLAIWCKLIDYICNKISISAGLGNIMFNLLSTIILLIWIGTNAFFLYFFTLLLYFLMNSLLKPYKIKN
ncbi:hypothetical protein OAK10_04900 [Candidatus Pelagibacter sp.]|nr:hypothetical protein [Candidatus Pelagibacter sp.]